MLYSENELILDFIKLIYALLNCRCYYYCYYFFFQDNNYPILRQVLS